jgi:hypothetical protein
MRIAILDHHGKELDALDAADGNDAPAAGMVLLARLGCLYPGSLLVFDDDKPRREPEMLMTITMRNLSSLAGRLEHRAAVIDIVQPLSAEDLRTAARFCRHALKVGWVGKTSIAIA